MGIDIGVVEGEVTVARGGAPPLLVACAGIVAPAILSDVDVDAVGRSRVDCWVSAESADNMLGHLNNTGGGHQERTR